MAVPVHRYTAREKGVDIKPSFNCTLIFERKLKNANRAQTDLLLNLILSMSELHHNGLVQKRLKEYPC